MDVGIGTERGDHEFTDEEARCSARSERVRHSALTRLLARPQEASAFSTNRTMCICQLAISAAQLTVCAVRFNVAPLRNTVNIVACVVSLPLVGAGLYALSHPEVDHAVAVMQVYQLFFLLRSLLVSFDYGFLVDTRKKYGTTHRELVIATLVLICILVIQCLNSLLVMAVIRIMRRVRNQAVARGQAATETSPLLPAAQQQGYAPPQPMPADA